MCLPHFCEIYNRIPQTKSGETERGHLKNTLLSSAKVPLKQFCLEHNLLEGRDLVLQLL